MLIERYAVEEERLRESLRELRAKAGLTQAELATRLGSPQSLVSKYESGERTLSFTEVMEIIRELGLTPVEFVQQLAKEDQA
jgi:transcriptional regulator with XRE-family HTH domain